MIGLMGRFLTSNWYHIILDGQALQTDCWTVIILSVYISESKIYFLLTEKGLLLNKHLFDQNKLIMTMMETRF